MQEKELRKELTVWVISDDSYRSVQAIEVAKRLSAEPEVFSAESYRNFNLRQLPDIVIGAGEETGEAVLTIKNAVGKCYGVIILDPRKNHRDFDLIVLPSYEPHPDFPNVFLTTGLINHINKPLLDKTLISHQPPPNLVPPYLAVLVGGKHVGGNITSEDAEEIAALANGFAEKNNASILIATCDRTEKAAVRAMEKTLSGPNLFYDYNGGREIANPYIPFLALADAILVTGDSLRMCSEACSAEKDVFIYDSENIAGRYKKLHEELFAGGYARPHWELNFDRTPPGNFLDEAGRVAEFIKSQVTAPDFR